MATTCVVTYKNGREQYIEIGDEYDSYEWEEEDGFFYLYGRDNFHEKTHLIAKIRLKAINGYYFE
ncbi:MAG: hypothetical protein IKP73_08265 [Bacteroidales bacterium]|nr:hypothetical protein [Bacteroidales bacterium]MBR4626013.1 hypothetical protein [Alphaproteobacteria bacterium]